MHRPGPKKYRNPWAHRLASTGIFLIAASAYPVSVRALFFLNYSVCCRGCSSELRALDQKLHLARPLPLVHVEAEGHQGTPVDGIWFGHTDPLPSRVLLAFRLDVNEWKGERKVQFLVAGAQL